MTYRLADSLPADVLLQLETELRLLPRDQRDPERRKRIDAWLDAGHGSCALCQPEAGACVVDTWRHYAGERYDLIAWVVMPNHVHVLIRAYEGVSLGKIVQSWKSFTSRRIGELAASPSGLGSVWMREYWDRFIRDERHFEGVIRYIHENPVKAGLVKRAEEWPWSSARGWADET